MKFRDVAGGRRISGPSLDEDSLELAPCSFQGEFDVDQIHVHGGDSSKSKGSGYIVHSIVSDIDLSASIFSPFFVSDARLKGIDFSNTVMQEVVIRRAEWLHGRAIGLRFSAERLEDCYVEGVRLDYSTIHVEHVKGLVVFSNCSFREAEISGDLSNVVFDECILSGVRFAARTAKGADFKTSRLDAVRGLLSLRGATITAEQATLIADQIASEAGFLVEG